MSVPLIVTALLGDADFAWLDALRQRHFPAERNYLRAHLTLFHHIAPALEAELVQRVKALAKANAPAARLAGLINLGRGVAYRIESQGLESVRAELADAFSLHLLPQDRAGWRPHVTVQNKVRGASAKALLADLSNGFAPRPIEIAGIAIWRYLGGPWEGVGGWRFGNGHRMQLPG